MSVKNPFGNRRLAQFREPWSGLDDHPPQQRRRAQSGKVLALDLSGDVRDRSDGTNLEPRNPATEERAD